MCNCILIAEKGLAAEGARLDLATMIHPKTGRIRREIQIKTTRLGPKKRTKVPYMVCTFCPFCGEEIKRD